MKIDLADITGEDALKEDKSAVGLAGYVHVMPNGGWHAFRVSTGYEKSGDGTLAGLEPGLWISNIPFEQADTISKNTPNIVLRSDGWLKMNASAILASWGMTGVNERSAARLLASVTHRICNLLLEAVHAWDPAPATRRRALSMLMTRPSLATAIGGIIEKEFLANRSAEIAVGNVMNGSFQQGMFCFGRKVAPSGFANLPFSFPKLSYMLSMVSEKVPDKGVWKIGTRQNTVSQTEFLESAVEIGNPLIFRSNPQAASSCSDYFDAFTGSNRGNGTYRSLFILDEYEILRSEIGAGSETVFVGEGWSKSKVGALIEALVAVCGGRQVATHSFTANLLAENIFASTFRKPVKDNGSQPPEAVWLAARDRIACYRVVKDFYQFGATLVSAQHGTVMIQCPLDPELLSGIMETAWRHAMTLPMDRIGEVAALGVPIPSDRPSFGGNPVDYAYCAIAQTGKKRSLFFLDEILDASQGERSERMRALFS